MFGVCQVMVLEEGGPCSCCGATESHLWYGGTRKPARCKDCYDSAAKEARASAKRSRLAVGTPLDQLRADQHDEPEDKMLWQIYEVLGQR